MDVLLNAKPHLHAARINNVYSVPMEGVQVRFSIKGNIQLDP